MVMVMVMEGCMMCKVPERGIYDIEDRVIIMCETVGMRVCGK